MVVDAYDRLATLKKETLLLVQGNSRHQNLNRFSLEQQNRCFRARQ